MANKQPKETFWERKGILLISALCSVLCLTLLSAAFGTSTWVRAAGCYTGTNCSIGNDNSMKVTYGLFSGSKIINLLGSTTYGLHIVCLPGDNICMWSCMGTPEQRQQEINDLQYENGASDEFVCTPVGSKSVKAVGVKVTLDSVADSEDFIFLNYGLWVMTVVFLSFAVIFATATTSLAFLNVFSNPIENYMGPLGLHVGNALTISSVFLAIIMWASQFHSYVVNDIGLRDTMTGVYTLTDGPYLDSSMWMLVSTLTIQCGSACCVYLRDSLRKENTNVVNEDEPVSNGAILIY